MQLERGALGHLQKGLPLLLMVVEEDQEDILTRGQGVLKKP